MQRNTIVIVGPMLQKYLKAIIGQILVGDKPRHFRNASALRQGRDKRIGIRCRWRSVTV